MEIHQANLHTNIPRGLVVSITIHHYSLSVPVALNSTNYGYLLLKQTPNNRLLFMDDLKLYSKTEHELQ